MRLEEEFVGQRQHFAQLLLKIAEQIKADEFTIRGRNLKLPDVDMEFKISHKFDHGKNKLSVSIEWLDLDLQT